MIIYKPLQNISVNPLMFLVTDKITIDRYIDELVEWAEQAGQSQILRLDLKYYKKIF